MNIFGLGTPELILILVVFLLFFGKDKLPEFAKSIGKSFQALKDGFKEGSDTEKTEQKSTTSKDSKK